MVVSERDSAPRVVRIVPQDDVRKLEVNIGVTSPRVCSESDQELWDKPQAQSNQNQDHIATTPDDRITFAFCVFVALRAVLSAYLNLTANHDLSPRSSPKK